MWSTVAGSKAPHSSRSGRREVILIPVVPARDRHYIEKDRPWDIPVIGPAPYERRLLSQHRTYTPEARDGSEREDWAAGILFQLVDLINPINTADEAVVAENRIRRCEITSKSGACATFINARIGTQIVGTVLVRFMKPKKVPRFGCLPTNCATSAASIAR